MKVCFAADVINDAQYWRHLDEILSSIDDGWHEWDLDDPDTIEQSNWLTGTNRPHIRTLFENAAKASIYPSTLHKRRWLVSMQPGVDKMLPQAAARFFRRPLFICVENHFTDGIFLDAVVSTLATPEMRSFLDRCQGKPIEPDHAGGSGELTKAGWQRRT